MFQIPRSQKVFALFIARIQFLINARLFVTVKSLPVPQVINLKRVGEFFMHRIFPFLLCGGRSVIALSFNLKRPLVELFLKIKLYLTIAELTTSQRIKHFFYKKRIQHLSNWGHGKRRHFKNGF